MAEQTSIIEEGVDRVNAAYESLDKEFQRFQRQFRSRRKAIEKQITSSRRTIERRTRKQVNQLRSDLRKSPLVKRARSMQADAVKQVEGAVDNLLGALQIASKSDLQRIDRKLSQLNRKLKELERQRKGNGPVAHA